VEGSSGRWRALLDRRRMGEALAKTLQFVVHVHVSPTHEHSVFCGGARIHRNLELIRGGDFGLMVTANGANRFDLFGD
jgi:hypothetical protein